ncbi:peptide ABC transporter substrate-binding protein [Lacticaseibacillus hulanensis]|uniref:peptide ABC transporter substrate-binding protein n=1 Tax=Lacticaseibacillus hulanensis TaxID=2493111 RepID=UPI000FDB515A|nr:peptide ABC transporter substrate-binding protein [Lacticaseibacillus hulanensis]
MAKKFSVISLGMAATMMLLLAACGHSAHKGNGQHAVTLARMESDLISTMDPARATDAISSQAMANVYSGLYRYAGKTLRGDMATGRAKVTNGQKTYTFKLRPNAKWSDGKAVTAQDFVYAWRRAINPATKSEYAYLFSGIKNADAIIAGNKPASSLGVYAQGKRTLKVELDRVIPYFEPLLTLKTFYPVEKAQVEKYGDKYGNDATTLTFNGPFTMKHWQSADTSWVQTKNKAYWNAKNVHLDKIKNQVVKSTDTAMNLFQDGKLDDVTITGDAAKQMQSSDEYNVVPQNATFYLELNQKRVPAFANLDVRRALSAALNRKQFVRQVLGDGSQPAKTVIPTGMMYSSTAGKDFATEAAGKVGKYAEYDLAAARKLFAKGMTATGTSTLHFTIVSDDTDNAKNTLAYLQNAFSKLATGKFKVDITTRSVPFKTRIALSSSHETDMVVSAWAANYPDPSSFLDLFTASNQYNSGQWHNAQYDQLVRRAEGADAVSATKRWTDMQRATQILASDVGVIPFYQRGAAHLTNGKVQGMQLSPNGLISFDQVTMH